MQSPLAAVLRPHHPPCHDAIEVLSSVIRIFWLSSCCLPRHFTSLIWAGRAEENVQHGPAQFPRKCAREDPLGVYALLLSHSSFCPPSDRPLSCCPIPVLAFVETREACFVTAHSGLDFPSLS